MTIQFYEWLGGYIHSFSLCLSFLFGVGFIVCLMLIIAPLLQPEESKLVEKRRSLLNWLILSFVLFFVSFFVVFWSDKMLNATKEFVATFNLPVKEGE